MKDLDQPGWRLAAKITSAASLQSYLTIRLLVDRKLVHDAFLAYGYFRWVDDVVDACGNNPPLPGGVEICDKMAFIHRQKELLDVCYKGQLPDDCCLEERMLVELVRNDSGSNPGLQSYLRNMMGAMEFDAGRRGRAITHAELAEYSCMLATAVTDAMFYFIGHDDPAPERNGRYLAVTGAHITHMLRDTKEDILNGYFNIPSEYLLSHRISQLDTTDQAFRRWVCSRVKQARKYFREGHAYISRVKNLRCRLAGYAYAARFEWMLHVIEADNYCLRSEYHERRSLSAGLWMAWKVAIALFTPSRIKSAPQAIQASGKREQ